ncbi:MAG TPA: pyrimidine dimer DNA glycosylase/endonuclease V [Bryobacteraceae bacterium]|nr:pyrimidine dimer DNA glycosylase/endonuclease V [Bryobacteraceae bacterium]
MRLWSLHPSLLDRAGLVALWREALLAQHVLLGRTRGYRFHPQLERFRQAEEPGAAIAAYLSSVHEEADARGYRFDSSKIVRKPGAIVLTVTRGQLVYELGHLRKKLGQRDPVRLRLLPAQRNVKAHPMFRIVPGPIESWERPTL